MKRMLKIRMNMSKRTYGHNDNDDDDDDDDDDGETGKEHYVLYFSTFLAREKIMSKHNKKHI